jgi:hypothetical protein
VSFQVIYNGAAGNVADQVISNQINVLNTAFAPYKFQFRLREIVRTNNAALYAACNDGDDLEFKPQLRDPNDGPDVLYIYTCELLAYLGYAYYPSAYAFQPLLDGVVITFDSLPGGVAPFNLGQTATHEVGHW